MWPGAITGGLPGTGFPYDEPLGLGHSLEAHQLNRDAMRIILFESKLGDVLDPLAGSYYVEALTGRGRGRELGDTGEDRRHGGRLGRHRKWLYAE